MSRAQLLVRTEHRRLDQMRTVEPIRLVFPAVDYAAIPVVPVSYHVSDAGEPGPLPSAITWPSLSLPGMSPRSVVHRSQSRSWIQVGQLWITRARRRCDPLQVSPRFEPVSRRALQSRCASSPAVGRGWRADL
jgi:hypothetical protein